MKGDPYYIKARYIGECSICRQEIRPGERCLYFPLKNRNHPGGRSLQCEKHEECRRDNERVMSAIHDEDFFPNRSL